MSAKYDHKLISGGMLGALMAIIALVLIFALLLSVFIIVAKPFTPTDGSIGGTKGDNPTYPFRQDIKITPPDYADKSATISSADINSEKAVVLNLTDNKIIASRQSSQIIYPASMTKVMTLIVVFENLKNESSLNEVLTISEAVQSQMEALGSSGFGLKAGEKLTVRDLLYVMILQSDNIACVTLAEYIAGSEADFVKLMNAKAREMGLAEEQTLFQNCTGLHHKYHFTTCKDMSVIMAYAMQNTFCAEILTAKSYVPSNNFRPADQCTFWNAFLVHGINEGKVGPDTAEIRAGKTGYTDEAKSCLVSYAVGDNGKEYIVVTASAKTSNDRLNDQLYLYNKYVK